MTAFRIEKMPVPSLGSNDVLIAIRGMNRGMMSCLLSIF